MIKETYFSKVLVLIKQDWFFPKQKHRILIVAIYRTMSACYAGRHIFQGTTTLSQAALQYAVTKYYSSAYHSSSWGRGEMPKNVYAQACVLE